MTPQAGTAALLEQEVERGTALGATVQVRYQGEVVLDLACGRRDQRRALTTADDVPWYSASKLATSVALARGWELGLFDLEAPVTRYLPEFGGGGKGAITIRHLWTYTAPLLGIDRHLNTSMTAAQAIERICTADADPGWIPGTRAGYLGHAGLLLLAEVVTRGAGVAFGDFFAQQIAEPLGLRARVGPPPAVSKLVDVPFLGTAPTAVRYNAGAGFPSNCVTGPFGDAAALCAVLIGGGALGDQRILRRRTVAALTAPQRVGLVDERLGMRSDYGLGLALDQYDFGRYCSPRTFGHGGARSSVAFGDPVADLCVAIFFNGLCPLRDHIRRVSAAASAVYLDLGIVRPSDAGRDHETPFGISA